MIRFLVERMILLFREIDDQNGYILQTLCVQHWDDAIMFLDTIPNGRIVAIHNRLTTETTTTTTDTTKTKSTTRTTLFHPRIGG